MRKFQVKKSALMALLIAVSCCVPQAFATGNGGTSGGTTGSTSSGGDSGYYSAIVRVWSNYQWVNLTVESNSLSKCQALVTATVSAYSWSFPATNTYYPATVVRYCQVGRATA